MNKSVCSLTQRSEHLFEFGRYIQTDEADETVIETARQLLFMLTEPQREVFALSVEGLTPSQIADELCITAQAVYSRIYTAKKALKENSKYFFL